MSWGTNSGAGDWTIGGLDVDLGKLSCSVGGWLGSKVGCMVDGGVKLVKFGGRVGPDTSVDG